MKALINSLVTFAATALTTQAFATSQTQLFVCNSADGQALSISDLGDGLFKFDISGLSSISTFASMSKTFSGRGGINYQFNAVDGSEISIETLGNKIMSASKSAYYSDCSSVAEFNRTKVESLASSLEDRPVYSFLQCSPSENAGSDFLFITMREGLIPNTMVIEGIETEGRGGETLRSIVRYAELDSGMGSTRIQLQGTASLAYSAAGRHSSEVTGLTLLISNETGEARTLSFNAIESSYSYRCSSIHNLKLLLNKVPNNSRD